MLRLLHLITVICIIIFPQTAIGWSWGSKEEEEPAKVDDQKNDGATSTTQDIDNSGSGDPLIDGFPDLVKWFRDGGGISKYDQLYLMVSYTCHSKDMLKSFTSLQLQISIVSIITQLTIVLLLDMNQAQTYAG